MNRDSNADLQRQIASLKAEVDSLQILSKNFVKPWHKDVAGLMSIVAVLFSLGTTAVSYHNSRLQEIQARRLELRELLGKLGKLPRDTMEYSQKYADNPGAVNAFSALVNNENSILAKQASEVAESISDLVSAAEHIYIGTALTQSSLNDRARTHFEAAAKSAKELNDVVATYRSLGYLAFMTGDIGTGRQYYEKAKTELRTGRVPGLTQELIEYSDAITEIRWAQIEAFRNACPEFVRHMDQAGKHVAAMPPAARFQVLQEMAQIRALGCPVQNVTTSAKPTPPAPARTDTLLTPQPITRPR